MKSWFFILCLVLISACKGESVDKFPEPDNLLEKEQLIPILADLSIVESAYQVKYIQVSRYSTLLQKEADSIFQRHEVTRDDYEKSMEYYSHNQEELMEIYQEVKKKIEKQRNELPPESERTIIRDTVKTEKNQPPPGRMRTEEDIRIPQPESSN
jgi:hypothetical protein